MSCMRMENWKIPCVALQASAEAPLLRLSCSDNSAWVAVLDALDALVMRASALESLLAGPHSSALIDPQPLPKINSMPNFWPGGWKEVAIQVQPLSANMAWHPG